MAFNKNELILDRVRSLTTHDIATGEMFMRLTSLEEPSLSTSAEGEEVVDAIGALITTLYRAKRATFSATNSLISIDLLAAQYGTKKQFAGQTDKDGNVIVPKIVVPTFEILTVNATQPATTTVNLKHLPANDIGYIYSIADGEVATTYVAGEAASATEFVVGKTTITVDEEEVEVGQITLPTGFTGKLYVEYDWESTDNAMKVVNSTENFPEACMVKIYAYFRDKCNENLIYSGVIVCPKAKLNPESTELTMTATGKHPFEFTMMKDYCDEEAELFSVIIAGGQD